MTTPTITVSINGTQLDFPARLFSVMVVPTSEEEFTTLLRGVMTIPGAGVPNTAGGLAAHVRIGDIDGPTISVLAPPSLRDAKRHRPASPEFEAAVSDAVNVEAVAS